VRYRVLATIALTVCAKSAAAATASCTASATAVSFGTYDPLSATATTSTGMVTVSCNLVLGVSLLVSYNIQLTAGSGSYSARSMKSGTNSLTYNLYTDNTYGTVWGDGSGATSRVSDGYLLGLGGAVKNYTVYGRAPAMQNVGAGTYSDAIIVTLTY
jgi:spore coat protein U-like protein